MTPKSNIQKIFSFRLPEQLIAALDKLSTHGSPTIKDRNRNQIVKIALERLIASEKKNE